MGDTFYRPTEVDVGTGLQSHALFPFSLSLFLSSFLKGEQGLYCIPLCTRCRAAGFFRPVSLRWMGLLPY